MTLLSTRLRTHCKVPELSVIILHEEPNQGSDDPRKILLITRPRLVSPSSYSQLMM